MLYQTPLRVASPNPRGKLRVTMERGIRMSRDLGHRMDVPVPDADPGSAISHCLDCGRFAVADITESPDPYGRATVEPCTSEHRPVLWGVW